MRDGERLGWNVVISHPSKDCSTHMATAGIDHMAQSFRADDTKLSRPLMRMIDLELWMRQNRSSPEPT